ncbi:hypothetical protein CsSME_00005413 [Camellia sinensis var. sinensis]
MFPLIFAIAADVEELVALVRVRQGQSYTWNLHLHRNVQDWELDQLVGLLGFLYELQFGGDGEDTLSWEGTRAKGIFLVSSFYGMLEGGGVGVFPWKNIWAVGSPSKGCENRQSFVYPLLGCVSALEFDCCFIWFGLGAAGPHSFVSHSIALPPLAFPQLLSLQWRRSYSGTTAAINSRLEAFSFKNIGPLKFVITSVAGGFCCIRSWCKIPWTLPVEALDTHEDGGQGKDGEHEEELGRDEDDDDEGDEEESGTEDVVDGDEFFKEP